LSNLLKNEKSPYLKQHENNPVHWYPWNKKALDKAKELKKPIFLSVGYQVATGVMSWHMKVLKTIILQL